MKRIFFICLLCFQFLGSQAQESKGNTFVVTDNSFDKNVSLKIATNQTAVITINEVPQTVAIEIVDGKILLRNKADNAVILQKLNIPAAVVDERLKQYGDINSLEKLLTNANEVPLKTLFIKSEAQLQKSIEETDNKNDNAVDNVPATTDNSLLWYILLPVAGILIGFLIGKSIKSKPVETKVEVEEEAPQPVMPVQENAAPAPVKKKEKSNVTITQLKAKYEKLQADTKVLELQYKELEEQHKTSNGIVQADLQYYTVAFQDIILPLQNAIDKGNIADVFKYTMISSLLFSAITREKLAKRQNYDITNINTLLKAKSDHRNYPDLTQTTAVDKTPVNLRQTLSVLKQLGVKDLDNYIIQGYKIKDL